MGGNENRFLLFASQFAEKEKNLSFTGIIEESRRFVQENDRGFLSERFCYQRLLSFAVAECCDSPVCEIIYLYLRYGLLDNFKVFFGRPAEDNAKYIAESGKKTLAQVFCDCRYPRSMNEDFSRSFAETLRKKGFLK